MSVDSNPSAVWIDEAAPAAQAICVAETGRTVDGEFRLYAPLEVAPEDVLISPAMLLPSAAWSKIAGPSILSFRVLAALVGLTGLAAVGWAAYALNGRRLNWVVSGGLLLTSPWIFHYSRVYWEPTFGFAVWALALALWAQWRMRPTAQVAFAMGFMCSLAMFGYAPFRVGVPLSLVVMFWPRKQPGISATRTKFVVGGLLLGLLPVLTVIRSELYWKRGGAIGIWNADYLSSQGKSLIEVPLVFIGNLARHLDPRFLFVNGDSNLRHGSGFGGVLSPIQGVTLAILIFAIVKRPRDLELRVLCLIVVGFVPAALTFDGLPHAGRALVAAPALLLGSVLGAELLLKKLSGRLTVASIMAIMMLFFVPYLQNYFGPYEQTSQQWFQTAYVDRWRETGEWNVSVWPLGGVFLEMAEGTQKCADIQASGIFAD